MNQINQQEAAMARHSAYILLSRVYLEGVSAELLPFLNAIPELAVPNFDADKAAAAHQNLFGFTIFPNASIFLDTSGLLGGEVSEKIGRLYKHVGVAKPDEPDHIGQVLNLLAFLCAAEAEAWEDKLDTVAQQMRSRQVVILHDALLGWLPPLIIGIQQQGDAFYAAIARITWALVGAHMQELTDQVQTRGLSLPKPPNLLDSDETSLKEIALYLTMPATSGWWFGRGEVGKIGRITDLPRGFGGRINGLMNLFRAASQFDSAETLFTSLAQLGQIWLDAYDELIEAAPNLQPVVNIWRKRMAFSAELLTSMRDIVNDDISE